MCWGFDYTYENIATKEYKKFHIRDIKGLKEFFQYYQEPLEDVVEDAEDLEDDECCLCVVKERKVVDLVIRKIMTLVYGYKEEEIPKEIVEIYEDVEIRYKEINAKMNNAISILDSHVFENGDVSIIIEGVA